MFQFAIFRTTFFFYDKQIQIMKITTTLSVAAVASTVSSLVIPEISSFFSNINQILIPQQKQVPLVNQDYQESTQKQQQTDDEYIPGLLSNPLNTIIPDHYVIVLKDGLSESQISQHNNGFKRNMLL